MCSRGDVSRNFPTRGDTHRPQTRSKKVNRKPPSDQGSGHAPVMCLHLLFGHNKDYSHVTSWRPLPNLFVSLSLGQSQGYLAKLVGLVCTAFVSSNICMISIVRLNSPDNKRCRALRREFGKVIHYRLRGVYQDVIQAS